MRAPAAAELTISIPEAFVVGTPIDGNRSRQMLARGVDGTVAADEEGGFKLRTPSGAEVRLIRAPTELRVNERALVPRHIGALRALPGRNDLGPLRWVGGVAQMTPADVRARLVDKFKFQEEIGPEHPGLRAPQLGAIHAVIAHWTTGSTAPVTVVMPTGTGKTDAMLGLFAVVRPTALLVLVPSDALRDQLAIKFETYGILHEVGALSPNLPFPIVGRLRHGFRSAENARTFAEACNVVIATPNALHASADPALKALLARFTHMFIDEAHHVAAATWQKVRDDFAKRPVVQFTATPYREDGQRLGGRVIYEFPLGQAQKQGYFAKIDYYPVVDLQNRDETVARIALERLRKDLAAGLDHILMARVQRISRAEKVINMYEGLAPDLHPVVLHSAVGAVKQRESVAAIRSRESRVVVCVDMLGEGFDLPSLKVAAIHDPHQSLGVTLQFIGRFARASDSKIGDACAVVSQPEGDYDENLRELYAENADWNEIIRDLSQDAVSGAVETNEFESGFAGSPEEVTLRNLSPKMSTVVYRTSANLWRPERVVRAFPKEILLTFPVPVNTQERVAWFVTRVYSDVSWGDSRLLQDLTYDLYVLYWDSERRLLYINSSNTDSLHQSLAQAVCGTTVDLINGEAVYRALSGLDRLVPTNVGLLDVRNRARRFSLHVGANVIEGFPQAEAQTKTKTNIFAYGFEGGHRVSIGAAQKGRVWSFRIADGLKEWREWCDHVGAKLADGTIDLDEVMAKFIVPKTLDQRPPLVPIAIEWPWEQYLNTSDEVRVKRGDQDWPLVDAELRIAEFTTEGPIRFDVVTPGGRSRYEATVGQGNITYRAAGDEVFVVLRDQQTPLSEWLEAKGVTIHFEHDAVIDGKFLLQIDRTLPPFDVERVVSAEWTGINLQKESQGPDRDQTSIQARAIVQLRATQAWDVVIDDDGPGEIADVVAFRVQEDELHIKLVHCKYSSEAQPGARIADLYEVCGQAQKSSNWARRPSDLVRQLRNRERKRQESGRNGFEVGDATALAAVAEGARRLKPRLTVAIVQPGLSKAHASAAQLELLASTEMYLRETALAALEVQGSA